VAEVCYVHRVEVIERKEGAMSSQQVDPVVRRWAERSSVHSAHPWRWRDDTGWNGYYCANHPDILIIGGPEGDEPLPVGAKPFIDKSFVLPVEAILDLWMGHFAGNDEAIDRFVAVMKQLEV
jgi:hypothetical protein